MCMQMFTMQDEDSASSSFTPIPAKGFMTGKIAGKKKVKNIHRQYI